ncbi:MAG TPA: cyanophycin synthetase, partial [Acidimicrobiales bacterium]|nr:cyanophycin synthetase [Acidimicrobiales bacterium]
AGKRVLRVSAVDRAADVCVEEADGELRLWVHGEKLTTAAVDARPSNVACAVAVALELGVSPEIVTRRLPGLPTAPHRLEPAPTAQGRCLVLDDTYNSNPAGARAALAAMVRLAPPAGRRVVVTPGMVELGRRQFDENLEFAAEAATVANDVVIVGRTNRRALLRGVTRTYDEAVARGAAADALPRVVLARNREDAVGWVRDNLVEGDVALFENDLPDHYP